MKENCIFFSGLLLKNYYNMYVVSVWCEGVCVCSMFTDYNNNKRTKFCICVDRLFVSSKNKNSFDVFSTNLYRPTPTPLPENLFVRQTFSISK